MKIGIAVSKLRTAIAGGQVQQADHQNISNMLNNCKGSTVQIDISTLPAAVINNLLKEDLSDAQRRALGLFSLNAQNNPEAVLTAIIGNPREFHTAIGALTTGTEPCAELNINGRWYPIILRSNFCPHKEYGDSCGVNADYHLGAGGAQSFRSGVNENTFTDDEGNQLTFTFTELLHKMGLRPLTSDLRDHYDNLRLAERYQAQTGNTMSVTGYVLMVEERSWWRGIDVVELGTTTNPGTVVIEGEMETNQQGHSYGYQQDTKWCLPFVRVFSLEKKRYAFVDVRDLTDKVWDDQALSRLVLPPDLDGILKIVFNTPTNQLFGDVVSGKAGGMIILAAGGPGVGKTLTAEVFAEHTHRPLYVLEMAELGTSLSAVEDSLRKIFRRAARWNAVLLFDEADVFMAKRDHNLERSAIVGVFLRLLDYYKGMLFLTSNRADVIDPAFKSRITLALSYPDLNADRRRTIWRTMLAAAGVTLTGDINGVPDIELNGRQIRNLVRLIKVVYGTNVTTEQIKNICAFSCR